MSSDREIEGKRKREREEEDREREQEERESERERERGRERWGWNRETGRLKSVSQYFRQAHQKKCNSQAFPRVCEVLLCFISLQDAFSDEIKLMCA